MIAVYLYIIVKNERIKVKAWWSMGKLPSFHVSPPLSHDCIFAQAGITAVTPLGSRSD
jgi:hypothetical protein